MAGAGSGLRQLGARAEQMARDWPQDAAIVVQSSIDDALRAATGDGSLSHAPDMGRATVDVETTGDGAAVTAGGSQRVWGILQRGTRAHRVSAGKGKVLRTPYGPRRDVNVSGVRAKRPFDEGARRASGDVEASAARAFAQVVGR